MVATVEKMRALSRRPSLKPGRGRTGDSCRTPCRPSDGGATSRSKLAKGRVALERTPVYLAGAWLDADISLTPCHIRRFWIDSDT